jgi:hypothetical protein
MTQSNRLDPSVPSLPCSSLSLSISPLSGLAHEQHRPERRCRSTAGRVPRQACTTKLGDGGPDAAVRRAMRLLPAGAAGAGDNGIGRSGQAASAVATPLAALLPMPFKLEKLSDTAID